MGPRGGRAGPRPPGGGLPAGVRGRDRRGNMSAAAQVPRGRRARPAASGLATPAGPPLNGAACARQGRSLPRRLGPAGQAGGWRQVTRLSSRWGHACAGRARAGTRVPAAPGTPPPGGDGARGHTPAESAAAVARSGRGRGDRPAPLKRLESPQQNGAPRPRALPALAARARQAASRRARPPGAAPTGAQPADGVRPERRGAAALAHGCKVLRPETSAPWLVEGAIDGWCATRRSLCREAPIRLTTRA
jgi:hypothetical protein